jgi:hypothetical protein
MDNVQNSIIVIYTIVECYSLLNVLATTYCDTVKKSKYIPDEERVFY